MSFEEYRKEIIKNIKHCLLRTQLQPVLFIGPGISQRYINAPNRRQLLKILAEKCPLIKYPYGYYSQIKNDDNYLIASEFCNFYAEWAWGERSKYYPERYFETGSTKDLFIKHDVSLIYNNLTNSVDFLTFRYAKEVEHLQKLKPHAIITTNYDDFLSLIFPGYKNIIGYDITNKNRISYGEIIKLHGCCHNVESLILTSEDYVHYEKIRKYISANLQSYFTRHPLFIFGYGVNDRFVKSILLDVKEMNGVNDCFMSNVFLVIYEEECNAHMECEKEIYFGNDVSNGIRVNLIYTSDYSWIFDALSSNTNNISVTPAFIHQLLERTHCFTSTFFLKKTYPLHRTKGDAIDLKRIGSDIHLKYPYTILDLVSILGVESYHAVNNEFKNIKKLTGIDIRATNNIYHMLLTTGRKLSRKYSDETLLLLRESMESAIHDKKK